MCKRLCSLGEDVCRVELPHQRQSCSQARRLDGVSKELGSCMCLEISHAAPNSYRQNTLCCEAGAANPGL